MKTSSTPAASSKAHLVARLKVAQKKADDAKKKAKIAKVALRHAKKVFKQAKKTSKAAKKVVKELKASLAALRPVRKRPVKKTAAPVAPLSVETPAPEIIAVSTGEVSPPSPAN